MSRKGWMYLDRALTIYFAAHAPLLAIWADTPRRGIEGVIIMCGLAAAYWAVTRMLSKFFDWWINDAGR